MEIVDFMKDRGAKFRTEVNGPMSKYGRTPYMYLSFGFSDKTSPFFKDKLDGAEKRTMLKVVSFQTHNCSQRLQILAATCDRPRKSHKETTGPEHAKKPRLEGYNNGERKYFTSDTPSKSISESSVPKRRLLVVSSSNDGGTTESYIEIGKERLISYIRIYRYFQSILYDSRNIRNVHRFRPTVLKRHTFVENGMIPVDHQ